MKAFTLRTSKENGKYLNRPRWSFFFIPERAETQGSTDQAYKNFLPPHTSSAVASSKRHQPGDLCLTLLQLTLSPSISCFHPSDLVVHETEVTTSRCQIRVQFHLLLSYRHCQEAFPPAFLNPHLTGIHHSQLCFFPYDSLQLSALPLLITRSFLLKEAWGGLLLSALSECKIMTWLLLFWTWTAQKTQWSCQLLEKWCPRDRFLSKARAPPDAHLWSLALSDVYRHFRDGRLQAFSLQKKHNFAWALSSVQTVQFHLKRK